MPKSRPKNSTHPDKVRIIMRAFYIYGYSYMEISEQLRIAPSTVRGIIRHTDPKTIAPKKHGR